MQSLSPYLGWLLAGVYGGGLVLAAFCDITSFTIPNRLSLGLALAALMGLACGVSGLPALMPALITAAGVLGVGAALFFAGAWGAGDAKLLAAVALWVGPGGMGGVALRTALAGGVLAMIVLAWQIWRRRGRKFGHGPAARIPYGVAIALGGLPNGLALLAH